MMFLIVAPPKFLLTILPNEISVNRFLTTPADRPQGSCRYGSRYQRMRRRHRTRRFSCESVGVRVPSGVPDRSKLCIACSDFFKSQRSLAPLCLLRCPVRKVSAVPTASPQHDIQQHHNCKTKNNTHCSRIRVRLLILLTFRDQLVHSDQDHRSGSKG